MLRRTDIKVTSEIKQNDLGNETVRWLTKRVGPSALRNAQAAISRLPDGERVYAVGDIHGRVDLLNRLLDLISDDVTAAIQAQVTLVFLGDYVDRGPDSRLVLETLTQLKDYAGDRVITLKGNHEQAFLGFIADAATGEAWAEHGGRETLRSYGVVAPRLRSDTDGWVRAQAEFIAAVPQDHIRFLKSLRLVETIGDYVFVHAGIRPGVSVADQLEHDLLWIRAEFLKGDLATDQVVVHGHTPADQPTVAHGRIGIDTGAYATGVLTAVKLQGAERSFLHTGA